MNMSWAGSAWTTVNAQGPSRGRPALHADDRDQGPDLGWAGPRGRAGTPRVGRWSRRRGAGWRRPNGRPRRAGRRGRGSGGGRPGPAGRPRAPEAPASRRAGESRKGRGSPAGALSIRGSRIARSAAVLAGDSAPGRGRWRSRRFRRARHGLGRRSPIVGEDTPLAPNARPRRRVGSTTLARPDGAGRAGAISFPSRPQVPSPPPPTANGARPPAQANRGPGFRTGRGRRRGESGRGLPPGPKCLRFYGPEPTAPRRGSARTGLPRPTAAEQTGSWPTAAWTPSPGGAPRRALVLPVSAAAPPRQPRRRPRGAPGLGSHADPGDRDQPLGVRRPARVPAEPAGAPAGLRRPGRDPAGGRAPTPDGRGAAARYQRHRDPRGGAVDGSNGSYLGRIVPSSSHIQSISLLAPAGARSPALEPSIAEFPLRCNRTWLSGQVGWTDRQTRWRRMMGGFSSSRRKTG